MAGYLLTTAAPVRQGPVPVLAIALIAVAFGFITLQLVIPSTAIGDALYEKVRGHRSLHYLLAHPSALRHAREICKRNPSDDCATVNVASVLLSTEQTQRLR